MLNGMPEISSDHLPRTSPLDSSSLRTFADVGHFLHPVNGIGFICFVFHTSYYYALKSNKNTKMFANNVTVFF